MHELDDTIFEKNMQLAQHQDELWNSRNEVQALEALLEKREEHLRQHMELENQRFGQLRQMHDKAREQVPSAAGGGFSIPAGEKKGGKWSRQMKPRVSPI